MGLEVHRASGGRSEDTSPDPEMAEGGSIGRWPVVGDEAGYTAGFNCFDANRQRVLALPLRSWADVWRKNVVKGRRGRRPLCRRSCGEFSAPDGS